MGCKSGIPKIKARRCLSSPSAVDMGVNSSIKRSLTCPLPRHLHVALHSKFWPRHESETKIMDPPSNDLLKR